MVKRGEAGGEVGAVDVQRCTSTRWGYVIPGCAGVKYSPGYLRSPHRGDSELVHTLTPPHTECLTSPHSRTSLVQRSLIEELPGLV